MATYVTQTTLLVDKNGGKTTDEVREGTVVKESDFGKELFERLVESGSVVKVSEVESASDTENEELRKENEELEARVAELQKQLEAAKKPSGSTTPAPAPQK